MKIYHVCEYCQQIFHTSEVQGEGAAEIPGICEECSVEMGLDDKGSLLVNSYYYN